MIFEVLRVTAHHTKFLHSESKGRSAELTYLRLFGCALGATISGIRPWPRSWLLQHDIRVLQAMTERCENLATRLRVGPLCSTIQLSPLSGWPQSTDEVTMLVDSVCTPWQLTLHLGWALVQG